MSQAKPVAAADGVVVDETRVGRFQMEARIGGTAILIDEPAGAGGLGSGPNPYDLLSAAVGACTAMTIRLYAERKAWPLTHVRVRVVHDRPALAARDSFSLEIGLEGALDETQRTRLMEIAQHCPVHLTLERGSEVATRLVPPEAPDDAGPADPTHVRDMEEACAR